MRAGCGMDRVAFMEEVWTVVQCYLMQEILDELDECEGRMTESLIDSALDENETNSPINIMHQESNEKVVYLCRTRKGTIRLRRSCSKRFRDSSQVFVRSFKFISLVLSCLRCYNFRICILFYNTFACLGVASSKEVSVDFLQGIFVSWLPKLGHVCDT